jgi:hypothetical protein
MADSDRTQPVTNPVEVSNQGADLLRPARALLGWIPNEKAYRFLASSRADVAPTDEQRALVGSARAAVASRQPPDQAGLVSPPPLELSEHEAALRVASPALFSEGWEVRLVDLSRVYAFQPVVYIDQMLQRTDGARADDLQSLVALTLPTFTPTPLRASFDDRMNAWVIVSSNPNLRLMSQFSGPVRGIPAGPSHGAPGFGFVVTVLPSYLQVAEFGGRFFLRDGYHRALGLLARGIQVVPALFRRIGAVEELAPPGALPQAAYLGPIPPTLPDYLEDDVSAEVHLLVSQKMVLVQGLEVGFLV